MMKFRTGLIYSAVAVAIVLSGCTKAGERETEETEGIVAGITAEQMIAAKEGRTAARKIITTEWKDSMKLQEAILDARAANSKYEIKGKEKCKASFDTAFFNTIRTVRPDLASQLQP